MTTRAKEPPGAGSRTGAGIVLAAGLLVLLIAAAVGSERTDLGEGRSPLVAQILGGVIVGGFGALAVLGAWLLMFRRGMVRFPRRPGGPVVPWWVRSIVTIGILVLVIVIALLVVRRPPARPRSRRRRPRRRREADPADRGAATPAESEGPSAAFYAGVALAIAVVLVVAARAGRGPGGGRRRRRRRRGAAGGRPGPGRRRGVARRAVGRGRPAPGGHRGLRARAGAARRRGPAPAPSETEPEYLTRVLRHYGAAAAPAAAAHRAVRGGPLRLGAGGRADAGGGDRSGVGPARRCDGPHGVRVRRDPALRDMRGLVRPLVSAGLVPVVWMSALLAVALAAGWPERAIAFRMWLVGAGLVALNVLVVLVGRRPIEPRWDAFDAAARPRVAEAPPLPASFTETARLVELLAGTAGDVHFRVRPVLREVAAHRLLAGHGLVLDDAADAPLVADRCGPLLWDLGATRPARAAGPAAPPVRPDRRGRGRRSDRGALMAMSLGEVAAAAQAVVDRVEEVVVGKRDVLELVLVGILADGHVLLEDLPGVAKTLIARSFAQATGIPFARVQFTPDLMPSDITGLIGVRPAHRQLRLPPRAGLHQPAARRRDQPGHPEDAGRAARGDAGAPGHRGGPHPPARAALQRLATQNPIEYEGTYPLPEAQLDRFLLRVAVGYPSTDDEVAMLERRIARRTESVTLRPGRRSAAAHRDAGRARGRARVRAGAALHRRRGDRDPAGPAAAGRVQPARVAGAARRVAGAGRPEPAGPSSRPTT